MRTLRSLGGSRRLAGAGVALVFVLTLTACGVPVDRAPAALPRNDVPFGLLRPSPPSSTTTSAPSPVEAAVSIFLVASSGHLVAVARELPATQESLVTVLEALVRGPTNTEAAAGLSSAVPIQTTVLGAVIGTGGVATVNLGGTFGQLVGQAQIEAVAQIVFTTTALPGVSSVEFELSGQSVEVPVASGAEVPSADRFQFGPLAPLPTTGSTG
jgi:Sporulation and spore germination